MRELAFSKEIIDLLYQQNFLPISGDHYYNENEYLILSSEFNSALVKVKKNKFNLIKPPKDYQGVSPKDARQKCFYDSLKDKDVLMSIALGKAGTGKTLLSIAYALNQYFKADKDIVLIKPSVYVGGNSNVMGILPGDLNDKMSGIMSSYMVHINSLLGRNAEHFIYEMLEKDKLKYLPVELARGMSLENATVIFDEAQNADIHTMKTIVSRVSSTSKLICLGDLGQIDAPFRKKDSGLHIFIESEAFKNSLHTSQIELKSQYRSVLADLCESITDEYYKKE
jgi:PhoH-like ATPase